jgi:hypothetical protein
MSNRWRQSILAVPGIGVSVLPKLACPACWPAYAGLLTSIGLGFLISVRYLLPLTITFLVLALAAMLFRARDRRGYGPFWLAVLAASGVLLGKFALDSRPTCIRRDRSTGSRFAMEYMASPGRFERSHSLFQLSQARNPINSLGEHHDHKEENRSFQRRMFLMQRNHQTCQKDCRFVARGRDS